MKYISSSDQMVNLDKVETTELCINKVGLKVQNDSEKVFAKTILSPEQTKYAILVFNNQPYDPYGVDSHRESKLNLTLKQVNKQTHDYYVSYLKSKNSLYMTRAQRSFING